MTTSVVLSEATAEGLRQMATDKGWDMPDLVEQAIRQYLRREAEKKVRQEEQTYQVRHEELLARYSGRYIALHHGEVVDSDENELALYHRVRRAYPMLGVLIKGVTPRVDTIWRVSTLKS